MVKRSAVIWFTGLSGAGKTTLATALFNKLKDSNKVLLLDGDALRKGLCSDLGYSEEDRSENIRRAGEVSKLMIESGVFVIAAFISPFRRDRERVRNLFQKDKFVEIYCDAALEICESRDYKGLYKKARIGKIKYFTGISSPYESPQSPELHVDTENESITTSYNKVIDKLISCKILELRHSR